MRNLKGVLGLQLVGVALLAMWGCGATPDSSESAPASTEESIINGNPVSNDAVGTPLLYDETSGGSCSSTMLRDRWLITARHCIVKDGKTSPANTIRASMNGVTAHGVEVYISPDHDVALLKLDASLPAPNGHAEPWEIPLYSGTSSSLEGKSFYCQGWGLNKCEAGGTGGLRGANVTVSKAESDGFTMTPNFLQQMPYLGDSGGSCYEVVNGRYSIIGVVSGGSCGSWVHLVGADAVKDWVDSIIDRVGVIRNGTLRVKEGGLSGAWVDEYSDVRDAWISGPRIAIVRRSDAHCLVKEGNLSAEWVDEWAPGGVTLCLVAGNRIGLLTSDGVFRVKEGSLSAGWVTEYSNVTSAALSGNRIGVLSNGHFLVKEGDLSAGWVDEYSNVIDGQLAGNRIGVMTSNGTLLVKEGGLSANWVTEYSNLWAFTLSGNRIGAWRSDDHFLVKEGGLSASWVDEYTGLSQVILSGKRIGVVTFNRSRGAYQYLVKEGGLRASWVVEQDWDPSGYIGVLPRK